MKDSSETVGWIVIVLLAIAAIIANTGIPRQLDRSGYGLLLLIIIFMTLIAICGVLAVRYKSRD